MNHQFIIRFFLLFTPFFLPWWGVLICSFAAVFYFEKYYEILIIGFLCDVLYHTNTTIFGMYGFTLLALLVFGCVAQIKKRLLVY